MSLPPGYSDKVDWTTIKNQSIKAGRDLQLSLNSALDFGGVT